MKGKLYVTNLLETTLINFFNLISMKIMSSLTLILMDLKKK